MNRTLSLSIPHRLQPDEVRRRIEQAVTDLHTRFASNLADLDRKWTGPRMDFAITAMGQRIDGWLEVREQCVDLEITLPWVFAMFAEKIRPQIEREAQRRLEHKQE